ncbi:MAG TPA: hypothetical protein VLG49_01745 [Rhabdochlamydiaceae bacterium]|nr:hypothetical protein [Rhabdochlamydiaceae bacterium]
MPILVKPPLKLPPTGCDLMLYRYNRREGMNNLRTCHIGQFPIYQQSAYKVRDLVCEYFDVNKKADRKLFDTVFMERPIDCFEFERHDTDIVYGVSVHGTDPDFTVLMYDFNSGDLAIPDSKMLSVKVELFFDRVNGQESFEKKEFIHGVERLKKYLSRDPWSAALMQSYSFKRLTTYSVDLHASRTIEKIDLMNAKFGRPL